MERSIENSSSQRESRHSTVCLLRKFDYGKKHILSTARCVSGGRTRSSPFRGCWIGLETDENDIAELEEKQELYDAVRRKGNKDSERFERIRKKVEQAEEEWREKQEDVVFEKSEELMRLTAEDTKHKTTMNVLEEERQKMEQQLYDTSSSSGVSLSSQRILDEIRAKEEKQRTNGAESNNAMETTTTTTKVGVEIKRQTRLPWPPWRRRIEWTPYYCRGLRLDDRLVS